MAGKIKAFTRAAAGALLAGAALTATGAAVASDHLDTRTVINDPSADIGDIYAWPSADGRNLNLVMTLVGHSFSPKLDYVFHVDSGAQVGATKASLTISCRFKTQEDVMCRAGQVDIAAGNAGDKQGLTGRSHRMRVFAGLRDDPFFNNVKGSRDAYQVAQAALRGGAQKDAAGCAKFTPATSAALLAKWRQTDGGPATNFLAGWTPASLIVSIDVDSVNQGGPLLAVWAATVTSQRQVDRMGRPLTGNALLAPLAPDEVSDGLKEKYNAAGPAQWGGFAPVIAETLGLYDSFDGVCGNQLLANGSAPPEKRYERLAQLLADDRLWVNSTATSCRQFFAVELAYLSGHSQSIADCGGRTPNEDAVDVYRSLLATGNVSGVSDGVDGDEKAHSDEVFPFLAAP